MARKYVIPNNRVDASKVKINNKNFSDEVNNVQSALEYLNNKISFNENGELVITIDGISKIFTPKTDMSEASYDETNEKIII